MEDKIAKIINENWSGEIDEELREVCAEYFDRRYDSSDSSDSDLEDEKTGQVLDDPGIQEFLAEDIPQLGLQDLYNIEDVAIEDVPVVEVETFENEEGPVIGEDEGLDIPLWAPYLHEEDTPEFEAEILDVHVNGCCKKKCNAAFSLDELHKHHYESRELDMNSEGTNSLDLLILGQIRAMCRVHDEIKTGSGSVVKDRLRLRLAYTLSGKAICERLFLLVSGIKIKRFKRLLKHYKTHGLERPVHKNFKSTPKKAFKHEQIEKVVLFIRNYAESSALFMPGRLANHKIIVKLLPSSDTKTAIYKKYKEACIKANETFVGHTVFKKTWLTFCREVVVMKPRTDLCAFCQKNMTSHAKLSGSSEQEKQAFFLKCQDHLNLVHAERASYKSIITKTKDDFKPDLIHRNNSGNAIPNSYDSAIHYSFDFAQQIHIPHDSQQPGPVYFLTPFKVGLFGVMNDTTKVQHNFLIPESVQISKGSNAIVSFLHHYLSEHSLGEKHMFMHADNCVGQNKNNIVMGYLMWRVIHNLNETITLSFLPAGHTKFGCDWAFGLFKNKFRKSKASSLQEVEDIVINSTSSGINRSIKAGTEKGDILVPIYDWLGYFQEKKWKAIKDITKFAHFEFKNSSKGVVNLKTSIEAASQKCTMTVNITPEMDFPKEIKPEGLNHKRKKYLFEKIRPFCSDQNKDLLCPNPGTPEDPDHGEEAEEEIAPAEVETPPRKKRRQQGKKKK